MRRKRKNKLVARSNPTHWALSHGLTIELGFTDGRYLPRRAGLLLYPEYFENGEPKLEMLPLGIQIRFKK